MADGQTSDEIGPTTLGARPLGTRPPGESTPAPIVESPARRPWQFSLRSLLLFTAAMACVASLATFVGVGVLVVAGGLTVCVFNGRGAFAAWQRPSRCGWPMALGWLLLAVSLFLPATPGCNGWQMARLYAEAQVAEVPGGADANKTWSKYVSITVINATNLLLLASPLLLVFLRCGRGEAYVFALATGATAAWTAPVPDPKDLLIGYYVWCLGQLCVLSAARLGPRTLVAMFGVAVVRIGFWPIG